MAENLKQRVTLADFEVFVQQSENSEKSFELIAGEIIEVPSNPFVSVIANLISFFIRLHLVQNQLEGHVTGEGGGFVIEGHVFAPDVAYVRHLPTNKGFEPTPPLLAVEVISDPHNNVEQSELRRKIAYYRQAAVLVWVVDYIAKQVEVHTLDGEVRILTEDETLTGGEILPGFELPVKEVFPKEG